MKTPPTLSLTAMRRRLASLRLTFALLVVVALLFALQGVLVDRSLRMAELAWHLRLLDAIGLSSPGRLGMIFYPALFLFVVNLALSTHGMLRRVRAKRMGARALRRFQRRPGSRPWRELTAPEAPEALLHEFLEARGFRVLARSHANGELHLAAGRRHLGYFGVVIFHAAFFILIAGALLSVLTRYVGAFRISPGDTFVEGRQSYRTASNDPVLFAGDRGFRLELESMELTYWKPFQRKEIASLVTIATRDGRTLPRARVAINDPLGVGDATLYQGTDQGFVARVVAEDQVGTRANGSLAFLMPREPDQVLYSRASLPGTTLDLEFELRTEQLGALKGLEALRLAEPRTGMRVFRRGPHGRLDLGDLLLGSSLNVEGIALRFHELRPFTSFIVVRDYGTSPMFAGFSLLILGLLVTFFWVPESVCITVTKDGKGGARVLVAGRSERFRAVFESRFAEMVDSLQESLARA